MPHTIAIDARKISSGTGRYVLELLEHLEDLDHSNTYKVLVMPDEANYYTPTAKNFEVLVADFDPYSFDEQIGFNKFLRRLKPDLVHFWMPQQPLMYTRRSVTTVHDLNLLRITSNDDMNPIELVIKKMVFRQLLRIIARRSKHILVPSHFTKDDLVDFAKIKPSKVTVTLEGAAKSISGPQPVKKLREAKFIMYVGRAEPYKNNRRLMRAHQKLLKAYPDLRLAIVGNKDILRRADMRWAKDKLYKNIDFLGKVSNQELAWLYRHCKAYVAPSLMEGFGLPGLEAMANGAVVVSSNTTCLPEIYGHAAYYFDPEDVNDMTQAIDRVIGDKRLRAKLAEQSQHQIKKYSWRRMAEQTLAVYKKVLS